MNMRIIPILALAGLCLFSACKEKQPNSDYISEFLHDRIIFEDENELVFDLNSGDQLFYLLRHAEKDTIGDDPGLTEIGVQRAAKLAKIFKKTRVDDVYSTLYMRTLLTVDSLVKSKGLNIKPYDPGTLSAFADSLRSDSNLKTAVVVGHSNTTPELARFLADTDELLSIEESEYENLYLVICRKNEENELLQLKFRTD